MRIRAEAGENAIIFQLNDNQAAKGFLFIG